MHNSPSILNSDKSYNNDVALLRLERPATTTPVQVDKEGISEEYETGEGL